MKRKRLNAEIVEEAQGSQGRISARSAPKNLCALSETTTTSALSLPLATQDGF
jgi:hypothetical protein